jgi:hypothetical protein
MGFYSSGPKIKESDIKIDDMMRRFCPNPVFVLIDVRPDIEGIPTTAYMSVEEVESVSSCRNLRCDYAACFLMRICTLPLTRATIP